MCTSDENSRISNQCANSFKNSGGRPQMTEADRVRSIRNLSPSLLAALILFLSLNIKSQYTDKQNILPREATRSTRSAVLP